MNIDDLLKQTKRMKGFLADAAQTVLEEKGLEIVDTWANERSVFSCLKFRMPEFVDSDAGVHNVVMRAVRALRIGGANLEKLELIGFKTRPDRDDWLQVTIVAPGSKCPPLPDDDDGKDKDEESTTGPDACMKGKDQPGFSR